VTDRVELPLSGASFGADPSFVELLKRQRPEAMPSPLQMGAVEVPQATTVLGLRYAEGIVMAGDRRATAGYTIADAKMKKVFAADDFSAIAI
jgi:proteasome beta subunit